MAASPRWEVACVHLGEDFVSGAPEVPPEGGEMLARGWEPFAVEGSRLWLRRGEAAGAAPAREAAIDEALGKLSEVLTGEDARSHGRPGPAEEVIERLIRWARETERRLAEARGR